MEGGLKETLGWWGGEGGRGANDGVREMWRRAGLDERVCCWTSVDGREGGAMFPIHIMQTLLPLAGCMEGGLSTSSPSSSLLLLFITQPVLYSIQPPRAG